MFNYVYFSGSDPSLRGSTSSQHLFLLSPCNSIKNYDEYIKIEYIVTLGNYTNLLFVLSPCNSIKLSILLILKLSIVKKSSIIGLPMYWAYLIVQPGEPTC